MASKYDPANPYGWSGLQRYIAGTEGTKHAKKYGKGLASRAADKTKAPALKLPVDPKAELKADIKRLARTGSDPAKEMEKALQDQFDRRINRGEMDKKLQAAADERERISDRRSNKEFFRELEIRKWLESSGKKMTHAYGNPYAKLVKARGDFASAK